MSESYSYTYNAGNPPKKKKEPIHIFRNRFGKAIANKIGNWADERREENRIYKEEFKVAKMQGLKERARREGLEVGQGKRQTGAAAFFGVPPRYSEKGERTKTDMATALLGHQGNLAYPLDKKKKKTYTVRV